MESEIILDVLDLRYSTFSPNDTPKDMNTKDLMKLLLRSRKEMKISKRELEAWCLKGIEELAEIGKTSISIRQQCGLVSSDEDLNASAIEDETAESSHEIAVKPSEEPKFRVLMDASNFKKEKVVVKIVKNQLVIHAAHETKADEHGTISREFTRKFDIPEDVDVETLRSFIDAYSVLIVEASFKPQKVEERELVILKDTCGQSLQPYKDLKQFKELADYQRKDLMELSGIAENLGRNCSIADVINS